MYTYSSFQNVSQSFVIFLYSGEAVTHSARSVQNVKKILCTILLLTRITPERNNIKYVLYIFLIAIYLEAKRSVCAL